MVDGMGCGISQLNTFCFWRFRLFKNSEILVMFCVGSSHVDKTDRRGIGNRHFYFWGFFATIYVIVTISCDIFSCNLTAEHSNRTISDWSAIFWGESFRRGVAWRRDAWDWKCTCCSPLPCIADRLIDRYLSLGDIHLQSARKRQFSVGLFID